MREEELKKQMEGKTRKKINGLAGEELLYTDLDTDKMRL